MAPAGSAAFETPDFHIPGVISTNVSNGPYKVYLGSLPTFLTQDNIIELVSAFGELRSFNLVMDANNVSKGFCFFEFVDHEVTNAAVEGTYEFVAVNARCVLTHVLA